MKRGFLAAAVAALALPVVALAALIGEQEVALANTPTLNVPLAGVDPRDLLRGRYIVGQLDWAWETATTGEKPRGQRTGGLCVLAGDGTKPRVRFVEGWKSGDGTPDGCRLMIAGRRWERGREPQFTPRSLDKSGNALRLYVPETRAAELEKMLRDRPGAVTVDLAVRRDGSAAIRALRVDGRPLGR
jgi:hypothetical protein